MLAAATAATDRDAMLTALDQGLKDRAAARGGRAGTLFANLAVVGPFGEAEKGKLLKILNTL